jgi:hypothetical protein
MSRHLPEILRHLDIDICLNLMTIRTSPKVYLKVYCVHVSKVYSFGSGEYVYLQSIFKGTF